MTDLEIMTHGLGQTAPAVPPSLWVDSLHLRFGGVLALDGPSLCVQPGEVVGLIGPNGAGKTTLFNCISRLYRPDSGGIRFGDHDLLRLRPDQITGVGIARTFQNIGLFPSQSVVNNVLVGSYHRTRAGLLATALALPSVRREERAERERARHLLSRLGLSRYEEALVSDLPFGALKRVEIARALMAAPRLLMLDEPANGLIHSEVYDLAANIRALRDEFGFSVLLVEHHMAMVMGISDRIVVLSFGRKIADAAPAEVQRDPEVIRAYLGGAR